PASQAPEPPGPAPPAGAAAPRGGGRARDLRPHPPQVDARRRPALPAARRRGLDPEGRARAMGAREDSIRAGPRRAGERDRGELLEIDLTYQLGGSMLLPWLDARRR